jgi:spore germination protein YaaH
MELDDETTRFKAHMEAFIETLITEAYARYDADPRVSGPDDFAAFQDAVRGAMEVYTVKVGEVLIAGIPERLLAERMQLPSDHMIMSEEANKAA